MGWEGSCGYGFGNGIWSLALLRLVSVWDFFCRWFWLFWNGLMMVAMCFSAASTEMESGMNSRKPLLELVTNTCHSLVFQEAYDS